MSKLIDMLRKEYRKYTDEALKKSLLAKKRYKALDSLERQVSTYLSIDYDQFPKKPRYVRSAKEKAKERKARRDLDDRKRRESIGKYASRPEDEIPF